MQAVACSRAAAGMARGEVGNSIAATHWLDVIGRTPAAHVAVGRQIHLKRLQLAAAARSRTVPVQYKPFMHSQSIDHRATEIVMKQQAFAFSVR